MDSRLRGNDILAERTEGFQNSIFLHNLKSDPSGVG
jgi:hypothetical protein